MFSTKNKIDEVNAEFRNKELVEIRNMVLTHNQVLIDELIAVLDSTLLSIEQLLNKAFTNVIRTINRTIFGERTI